MFDTNRLRAVAATVAVGVGAGVGGFAVSHAGTSTAAAAGRPAGAPSFNGGGPSFGRRDGFATDLAAAASYLGLTASELQTKLQRGSTLAQVAAATSGKTRAAVIAAIVEAEQQNAPSGVATRSTTELTRRVTALVSGTRPQRPPPGGGTPQGAPATTS